MISWVAASLLVTGFLILIKVLHVIDNCFKVISIASEAASVVTDKKLDDLSKEKQLQAATLQLLKLFVLILAGSIASVGIPAALIWSLHYAGIGSWDETLATTLSWPFIAASTVAGCIAFYFMKGKRSEAEL